MTKAIEDSVIIVEVFPYEVFDAGAFGNGLVSPSQGLIVESRAMDCNVIKEWPGDLRDLGQEEMLLHYERLQLHWLIP